MPNYNPRTEFLIPGQGRPRLGHKQLKVKISDDDRKALEDMAKDFGIYFANKPWIGGLIQKIARGEIKLVSSNND